MRLWFVALLLSCTATYADVVLPVRVITSPINLSAIQSRTSGIAPLAVFFDASGTGSVGVTSYPFHEIQYSWNFGDSVAGAATTCGAVVAGEGFWACGSRVGTSSKNIAYGPVAAHVFETAGTYTVTLTAYDGTNTATQTMTVTVTSADDGFPTTNTICVSTSGTFTGCPSGASTSTSSSFSTSVNDAISTSKRILFRMRATGSFLRTSNGSPLGGWILAPWMSLWAKL